MGRPRAGLAVVLAGLAAVALYWGRLRPWMYSWGADEDEVATTLPGDELVETATPTTTRAITIDAPVTDVWPWLVQIGENRGGFYSYSWFERAVGAHIHNAKTVQPQWQDVTVGDTVWLARRYGQRARQVVAVVKPLSHLVLMSPEDYRRVLRGGLANGAWGFYLREQGGQTRLLVRGSGGAVGHVAFDVPHFLMEQKMMRGIRDRAERLCRDRVGSREGVAPKRARDSIGLVK